MYALATVILLIAMSIVLFRAIKGPTIYDRILAVNVFGTLTVIFIAIFGFLTRRPEFLDIALVYALINFISTVAILKFFEYGDMATTARERSKEIDV